ncbi:MAG: polysulfide reductase NrfD, partial [Halodesulfurarchaeum sp.]|nr:polysulfide reductase NrfD [Halodesulfurarchaeum sp.]
MSQSSQAEPSVSEQGESLRYPWFAAIGIGLLVGLYGVYRILADGLVVLGITNQLPLGILISTYEFFLTMSAGIMIGVVAMSLVFGISRFDLVTKRGILLSFATLAAGLLTILIGLGRPDRALYQP